MSVVMFEGGLCLRVSYMCDVVQQILRTCWDNDLRNVTLIIATRNNISTINIPKICFSVAAGGRNFLVLWERSTRYSGILRVGRAKALGGLYPHGRRRRPKKIINEPPLVFWLSWFQNFLVQCETISKSMSRLR